MSGNIVTGAMTTSPASPRGGAGAPILGRERELARLDGLVDGLPGQGAALLVRGEPGIGKSVLLSVASRRAREAGMCVLRATGVQSEAELPFAGLHQLLMPLLDGAALLPAPHRTALLAAFGMAETQEAPDRFMIGLAVLELLSDAAERAPVLVVADDAQWLDPSTAAALGFVARRIEHEPVGLLVALRSGESDPFAETGLSELVLGGLEEDAAGALLAAQERDLSPEVRGRLLAEAGGNPLALVELPACLSPDELEGRAPLPAPLPLTARLERAFAAQSLALPEPTQTLLLLASADDGEGLLGDILGAARATDGPEPSPEDFAPAVSAGLVTLDGRRVLFRHPLVRSAVHQAASLADRRAAHAALAEVLSEQPDRQVWHRAAALVGPDERVAAALEEAAERARRRGAFGTAICALERSVGLSEDRRRRGERLLRAAELAFQTGRRELARRLLTEAQNLDLSDAERQRIVFMRQWFAEELPSGDSGVRASVEAAKRVARSGDGSTATNMLLNAVFRAFIAGAGAEVRQLIIDASTGLNLSHDDPRLVQIRAFAQPIRNGAEVIETLSGISPDSGDGESTRLLGLAAYVVGAYELSTSFLSASVDALRTQGRVAVLATALSARAHAHWHLNRWDLAASDADEARRLAEETGMTIDAVGALALESRLAAVRGEAERAEVLAREVERVLLPMGMRAVLIYAQWARGLAALGTGRHEEAYEQLIRAFRPDDPAWHYSERHFMVGDLAEAALHAGRREEARALLAETEAAIDEMASPDGRVAVEFARARCSPKTSRRIGSSGKCSPPCDRNGRSSAPGCNSPTAPGSGAIEGWWSRGCRFAPPGRPSTPWAPLPGPSGLARNYGPRASRAAHSNEPSPRTSRRKSSRSRAWPPPGSPTARSARGSTSRTAPSARTSTAPSPSSASPRAGNCARSSTPRRAK